MSLDAGKEQQFNVIFEAWFILIFEIYLNLRGTSCLIGTQP